VSEDTEARATDEADDFRADAILKSMWPGAGANAPEWADSVVTIPRIPADGPLPDAQRREAPKPRAVAAKPTLPPPPPVRGGVARTARPVRPPVAAVASGTTPRPGAPVAAAPTPAPVAAQTVAPAAVPPLTPAKPVARPVAKPVLKAAPRPPEARPTPRPPEARVAEPADVPTARTPAPAAELAPPAVARPQPAVQPAGPPAPETRPRPKPELRAQPPRPALVAPEDSVFAPGDVIPPATAVPANVGPVLRDAEPPMVEQSVANVRKKARDEKRRRARLRISHVDPWTVMKTSFLFSIAAGIITFVVVYVLWTLLTGSGLFEAVNTFVADILSNPSDTGTWRIENYVSTNKVLGITALLCAVNVVILTALGTLTAFLYNLGATAIGGIEVTLAED